MSVSHVPEALLVPIEVIQLQRRPQGASNVSIEGLFATVRDHLPGDIHATAVIAPHVSRGARRRVANVLWARRWRESVVHVTGDILYVTPALGPRAVITFHDVGWVSHAGLAQKAFEFFWCTFPSRRAKIVTTVSEFTRAELLRLVPEYEDKVRVVPNCYDPAFRPAAPKIMTDEPIVLFVGTTENKNLERLSAALEGLACTLHIVGPVSAGQSETLRRHAIRWKNSIGLPKAKMVAAYAEADIVALPSIYEGFGLPIIEAQAVGRPVLSSNVASMPEVAGGAAMLVDPFDVRSIRTAIVALLEKPELRTELRFRGFANVRRFEPGPVAEAYAEVYREAASGEAVRRVPAAGRSNA